MEAVQKDREWHTARRARRQRRSRPSRRATCGARSPRRRGSAAIPACSSTPRSTPGTRRRTRRASTRRTRAREYMYLDDSACNLASLNLRKFQPKAPTRRVRRRVVQARGRDRPSSAQEIIVDNAKYPTEQIARRTRTRFRPLGLGYANLGALLMSRGLPYDSDAGARLRGRDHRAHDAAGPTAPAPRSRAT